MRSIAQDADLLHGMSILRNFMSLQQWCAVGELVNGEEATHWLQKVQEYAKRITEMPKTYETDGQGPSAMCVLHYFKGDCDWFIIEKDCEMPQHQAFAYCDLGMGFPELGYVSIEELKNYGVELDLYWTPKTLQKVKEERR